MICKECGMSEEKRRLKRYKEWENRWDEMAKKIKSSKYQPKK